MSRFLFGDELGNIKTLRYDPTSKEETKTRVATILKHDNTAGPAAGVQQLASSSQTNDSVTLSAAFSNGSCLVSRIGEDDSFEILSKWTEPRITGGRFVGMALTENSVFTCTSNGMLRKSVLNFGEGKGSEIVESHCGTLPSRLAAWRLSEDMESFAYGGDEVDLSVWNTELAFGSQAVPAPTSAPSKKRKRNDDLFPGEIWRARNVPNDHLGLRQPIRIAALAYLSSSAASKELVVGTQFGDLRRYDTRAARRPIANWTGIAKTGGIKSIEKGHSEHELFVGDGGSSLYSIDMRTGKILYGYHGLAGAVTSIAPSPTVLASTSLDRYARVHSVVAPPTVAGSNQEYKGKVLEKVYVTSIPTAIVWDKSTRKISVHETSAEDEDDDDDIWNNMENVN